MATTRLRLTSFCWVCCSFTRACTTRPGNCQAPRKHTTRCTLLPAHLHTQGAHEGGVGVVGLRIVVIVSVPLVPKLILYEARQLARHSWLATD
jgi:hypothetical protein